MSNIDEIKSRVDIVDLVSETVKLRKSGKNYTGFCPFHPNSRTPAFVVFPESGTWRCFGQCNEGGDIFKFVMKKEGWDFPEALRHLAERAGIKLEPQTPERQEEEDAHERLRALLEDAVTFFKHHLLQNAAGKSARDYLTRRGLTDATIETFGLGYALDSWDAGLRYFTGKGYSTADLLAVGLITERQGSEGFYDRFRNRIMFPIRDPLGRMAGFGARILDPNDVPKFLNSPQTALFDKGRLLYGLDQARKAIRSADQVVIVEGYLDVIVLHQAGFANTVSPMGTALTEDQIRLLKRFSRRMVLALDADAAGEKATLRGLEVARQSLDRSDEMGFDARGLLRHEARLQADLRVTTLPPGADPDEVALADPQAWAKIIAEARPIVVHVMETLAASHNLDDPKDKSEIAARVLPLIEDIPNAVERDDYRQRLARLLRVDERALTGSTTTPTTRPVRRRPNLPGPRQTSPALADASPARLARSLEAHCLRLLMRRPELVYKLDRMLQQGQLRRFSPEDFEQADFQTLARLLQEALGQDGEEPQTYLQTHLPEDLEETAAALTAPITPNEPADDRMMEDLTRSLLKLRLVRISEGLQQLRFLQEEMQQESGAAGLNPYQEIIMQYAQTRSRLDQALGKPQMGDQAA
jgi:DNA primase